MVEYAPQRCFLPPFIMKKFLVLSSLLFLAACRGQVVAPETNDEAATDDQNAPATEEQQQPSVDAAGSEVAE